MPMGVQHLIQVDAVLQECIGKSYAFLVGKSPDLVGLKRASGCGGTEQTPAEPRAFFISPINEADRPGRWPILDLPPQDLQAGQNSQAAIEPATVGHGIEMTANKQRCIRFSLERYPIISGGIGFDAKA